TGFIMRPISCDNEVMRRVEEGGEQRERPVQHRRDAGRAVLRIFLELAVPDGGAAQSGAGGAGQG
ncbi:MAG: hypothetical protein J2P28_14690, partial [Actinobacteria bacterium]|nr:hypothetical protein [Actinomycetota bacterium]